MCERWLPTGFGMILWVLLFEVDIFRNIDWSERYWSMDNYSRVKGIEAQELMEEQLG